MQQQTLNLDKLPEKLSYLTVLQRKCEVHLLNIEKISQYNSINLWVLKALTKLTMIFVLTFWTYFGRHSATYWP